MREIRSFNSIEWKSVSLSDGINVYIECVKARLYCVYRFGGSRKAIHGMNLTQKGRLHPQISYRIKGTICKSGAAYTKPNSLKRSFTLSLTLCIYSEPMNFITRININKALKRLLKSTGEKSRGKTCVLAFVQWTYSISFTRYRIHQSLVNLIESRILSSNRILMLWH